MSTGHELLVTKLLLTGTELVEVGHGFMTGQELQQLILSKWGYSFDVQLRRFRDKIYLQVMWRYLEQASFPLDEIEYLEHLNAVASYLEAWGSTTQVKAFIEKTKERPRLGKAVNIPLDLGERASEWIVEGSPL